MNRNNRFLDGLKIASPCKVDWNSMTGDERIRACAQCRLNVYNLSEMTRAEAEHLIIEKEGRLCVRFYRRADGTVLTRDCPVGLRAARLKLLRLAGAVAGLAAAFVGGLGWRRLRAPAPEPPRYRALMGEFVRPTMGLISPAAR
jgi:hypothetical protein